MNNKKIKKKKKKQTRKRQIEGKVTEKTTDGNC
jgi:hypothetical protein